MTDYSGLQDNRASGPLWLRILLLLACVAGMLAVFCWIWISQGVSDQELLANMAKAEDFFRGVGSMEGWPWWSPHFLQGTSLAFAWGTLLSSVLLMVFWVPFGAVAGGKVAVVAALGFGAVGMYCFVRRWSGSDRAAWVGGFLYLIWPAVVTRAVEVEHAVVSVSMAILPWLVWAIVGFVRRGTLNAVLVAGVWTGALCLAYSKTALMALPVLVVFGAVEWSRQERTERPSVALLFLLAVVAALLGVVPNLPALREAGFVAMFEFGPFEGWQRAFSAKSALVWFDRDGVLGEGMGSGFAPSTGNAGGYLGLVCGALFVVALWRGRLHESEVGRQARLMLSLALGMFWLSFGPRNVIGGHFEFLRLSGGAADFTPAIAWFLIGAQVWIIAKLIPPEWRSRKWVVGLVSMVYLLVPGFLLIEWVPLFGNIRAPFDFAQVTGAVCLIAAAALSWDALIAGVGTRWVRWGLLWGLGGLALLDNGVYARTIFEERLPRKVWKDFGEAQDFLKTSEVRGRVYPVSGRYFYLMTPWMSGRSLSAEAFNSYLQQRGVATLQATAYLDDKNFSTYLRISGAAFVLVDKTDPDIPQKIQDRLGKLFPVAFENDHFAVFEVPESLGAGFLARDLVLARGASPVNALAALGGATHNLAMIEVEETRSDQVGAMGRVVEGKIVPIDSRTVDEGRPFLPVAGDLRSYQSVDFEPVDDDGWLVFNEAWHPDWHAYVDGERRPLRRAMLAFSGVDVRSGEMVKFRFEPPWWYDSCAWAGVAGWAGVLAVVAVGSWRRRE